MACDCCDENSIELPIGPQGDDGNNGNYITVTAEAAGLNCANGGFKLEVKSGIDDSVVTEPVYVCNGTNGNDGSDATTSLTANSVNTTTTTTFTNANVPSSALATITLPSAGSYLVSYDVICKVLGYGVFGLDYSVIAGNVGCIPDIQFSINGSVQSTHNASNPSQFIAASNSHAQHQIVVNTSYKDGTAVYALGGERKQTVSKTFNITTTGAETLSLYAWQLDPSVTATYSSILYTYQIDINAIKLA